MQMTPYSYELGTVIPVKQDDVTWGWITYRETALGRMWMAEAKGSKGPIFLGDEDTPDDAQATVLEFWGIG
jgi:hypothetical protein